MVVISKRNRALISSVAIVAALWTFRVSVENSNHRFCVSYSMSTATLLVLVNPLASMTYDENLTDGYKSRLTYMFELI